MGFIDHMQRHLSKERGGRGGPSSRGAATPLAVRARALGMLAIILIGTIAGAFLMNTPGIFAAPGTAQIEAINADELEPEGYSWSIDFDGIEIENGWTYEERHLSIPLLERPTASLNRGPMTPTIPRSKPMARTDTPSSSMRIRPSRNLPCATLAAPTMARP